MSKISLAIFDMDGLMFDTERISLQAWVEVGKDFGFHIEPSVVIETIGASLTNTEKVFKKHYGGQFPFYEIRKRKVAYALEYIADNGLPIKKGLYELLGFLEEKSVFRAVATNTERERTEKYLELAGVKTKFDIIVCGDEVGRGKPDPEIYLTTAQKIACPNEECIVLEDSENGIKAASRAKMMPILIPDIKRPAKEVEKLLYKEFESLIGVRDFLMTVL